MKPTPFGLAYALLLASAVPATAATITVNSQMASTTVAGNVDNTPPTQQNLPNSGSINATANPLTQTDLGGGSWEFNGISFANISAVRGGSGTNSDVVASAQVTYSIAFSLGVGESANVILDLGYSLSEAGLNGSLSWNFNGPGGSITGISGSVGNAATNQSLLNQNITQQQVAISAPGNYTFNLTANMPSQTTNKSQSVSVALNSVDFKINSVPEPRLPVLAIGSLGILLLCRRRNLA